MSGEMGSSFFQLLETASDSEIQPLRKRQLIAWSDRMLTAYIECEHLFQICLLIIFTC